MQDMRYKWLTGNEKLIETKSSSTQVYSGALLDVRRDEAVLPDGTHSVREWIKHPGASAVLPIFKNGDVILLKQYRYPLGQIFYEVPAGKLDLQESPEQTATRELEEEAGLRCSNLDFIGLYYPCIGYADEVIYFYLARELEEVSMNTDDDEFVERIRLPFEEAFEMIATGDLTDGKTMLCLLKAKYYLDKEL